MKQRKLKHIKCECGREVSVRALVRHLRATVNSHSEEFIDKCIRLIAINKTNRCAWKISDGVEGLRDDYWCVKVLNGELSLDELNFTSPRKFGENTPKTLKKISENRKGKGNPSLINKPVYDIEIIKKNAIAIFANLGTNPKRFKILDEELKNLFPNYRYSFVGMFLAHEGKRGHNRQNAILSFLIDKPIEWIISQKAIDRGNFIKEGQRNSPNFQKIQNAGRKGLRGHVSLAHSVLYNMILSLDKKAKKEKQIDHERTWKSYDIFSPSKNILFEMHGRVWHDLSNCPKNLITLVTQNVENDKIKEKLAKNNGFELQVFWDDECSTWALKLEEIYGKKPKSYEKALCQEIDKKAKR